MEVIRGRPACQQDAAEQPQVVSMFSGWNINVTTDVFLKKLKHGEYRDNRQHSTNYSYNNKYNFQILF